MRRVCGVHPENHILMRQPLCKNFLEALKISNLIVFKDLTRHSLFIETKMCCFEVSFRLSNSKILDGAY